MIRRYRYLLILALTAGVFLNTAVPVHAENVGHDVTHVARGAGKLFGSVFAIPKAMLQDSGRVMFPFGLVTGAVRGTVNMVTGVVGGVVDVATGSAPYAKYAALAL
jgi:hypothetical protein